MSAVKSTELKHKIAYFYRLHKQRISALQANGLSSLYSYLEGAFTNCHKDIFETGPTSSAMKFKLGITLSETTGHKMCKLVTIAKQNYLGTPHDRVEACALEHHEDVIAAEVPIWLKPTDLVGVSVEQNISDLIFEGGEMLTGHIDLVSVENGKIWIWDYKPNAHKERYAATQLFFYALMLAKRTKLSLEKFRCGYFDEKRAYLFKPNISIISVDMLKNKR